MARAAALAELAGDRVVWLQAQGPTRSDAQRLTLAEAEAEEVRSLSNAYCDTVHKEPLRPTVGLPPLIKVTKLADAMT